MVAVSQLIWMTSATAAAKKAVADEPGAKRKPSAMKPMLHAKSINGAKQKEKTPAAGVSPGSPSNVRTLEIIPTSPSVPPSDIMRPPMNPDIPIPTDPNITNPNRPIPPPPPAPWWVPVPWPPWWIPWY
jgi:hypothetical protein